MKMYLYCIVFGHRVNYWTNYGCFSKGNMMTAWCLHQILWQLIVKTFHSNVSFMVALEEKLPKSLRIILWGTWMCVQNLMTKELKRLFNSNTKSFIIYVFTTTSVCSIHRHLVCLSILDWSHLCCSSSGFALFSGKIVFWKELFPI